MLASLRFVAWVTLIGIAGSGCASSRGTKSSSPSTAAAPPTVTSGPTASPSPNPTPSPSPTPRPFPRDIRWVQKSAEYRALTSQVYRHAASRLRELSKGLAPGSWGVILDADETVLDNSEFQRRSAEMDSVYTPARWAAWCGERAAGAVPGAVGFMNTVHTLHGRVAIVTNRAESSCDATRDNLQQLGIVPDVLLCQAPGERDKNPRFQRVQLGTAAAGIPALKIVEWIGDNIQDFPDLTQKSRDSTTAIANFGQRYFVVPNPMYGSWER
jgi:5'-nucleotidase (lipoprotein e(P4) family)